MSLLGAKLATTNYVKNNLGAIEAGVAGLALGGTVGYIAGKHTSSKKRRSKRRNSRVSNHSSKKSSHSTTSRSRYTPNTVGKRRDTSHRRIRYTSRGQPYIIGAHGKAKFISKKSAKTSHKRSGGRY
jgi:hypothetical protein